MIESILIGAAAAFFSVMPSYLHLYLPSFRWDSPVMILGVAAVAMIVQRFAIDRKPGTGLYNGVADLMIHIHSPGEPDSARRWGLRGLISLLLAAFGTAVGPEGAAAELGHALAIKIRARSSRWLEQRRRTDAATALAAGVAAAFGSPFAAIVLPMELGFGGRSLSVILGALTAFILVRLFPPLRIFDINAALFDFQLASWKEWLGVLALTIGAGLLGVVLIRFIHFCQEGLKELFQTEVWMRVLAGGVFLFLVVLVHQGGHESPQALLENVLWSRRSTSEVGLLFSTQLLGLSLILAAFGTVGVFWPVFALGGFFGFAAIHPILDFMPGFSPVAAMVGGAAFWGAVFGAPFAGAILAYELSDNVQILLPCLLAALGAREIRRRLGTPGLLDLELEFRGLKLLQGRSSAVMNTIAVGEAMVTDHETVHEQEPVSDIHARLLRSKYPFLPVVNAQGAYIGLLTADMIQEAWASQDPKAAHLPLSKLLEAKDLLYRARTQVKALKSNARISTVGGIFEDAPCVPVVADDGRVIGLLFAYSVRLAYEREVSRRALALQYQR